MFLWHFKPIPLRKIISQKICLRQKKLLLEGLPFLASWFMQGYGEEKMEKNKAYTEDEMDKNKADQPTNQRCFHG